MPHIGILTYHRSINYGAVMQAYYLADALIKRYPDADIDIIDYMSKKMDTYYKLFTVYRGKSSLFRIKDRVDMYNAFKKGVNILPLAGPELITDDVEKFRKWLGNSYDVIIVGSDAVWNYSKRGLPNPYFLDDIPGIHMSYAASCNGLDIDDFSEIGEKDRDFLRKVLSNFTYIGVRDEQTEAFVRSILPGKETHLNCDPSFFANDLSDENRIVLQDRLENLYGLSPDKPVVGLMLSNHNGTFTKDFIDRLHSGYGDRFQTAAIYSYNRYADIPYMADLQPREWSRVFGLFDITISKYFHGTLFSLLNHTPVMSIGAEKNIGKYPNKVESVLGSMGLDELYFPAKKGEDINWDRFFDTFDHLINDDITLRIENGIKNEQKKAESFFRKLDVILGNKK